MKRLILIILFLFVNYFLIFGSITNEKLKIAYNLFKEGNLKEATEILVQIEDEIEKESYINKYCYYTILYAWHLKEDNIEEAISCLEKKAEYNNYNIIDLYTLANIYASTIPDRNKVAQYVRKALILLDKLQFLEQEIDITSEQLSRLYYLYGYIESKYDNYNFLNECVSIIKNIDSNLQKDHIQWLSEALDTVPINETFKPIIKNVDIKQLNLPLYRKESFCNYHRNPKNDLEAIESENPFDVNKYIHCVLSIEDEIKDLNEINNSKSLLEKAIRTITDRDNGKNPNLLYELYIRLGRLSYLLKKYNESNVWLNLAIENIFYTENKKEKIIPIYSQIALNYLELNDTFKTHLYADEMFSMILDLIESNEYETDIDIIGNMNTYAFILSQLKGYDFAKEIFEFVIDNSTDDSKTYQYACNNYGTMLFLLGENKKALEYFELIKEKFPTSLTISNLALVYISQNLKEKIPPILQEYVKSCLSDYLNYISNFNEFDWERIWEKEGPQFYLTTNYIVNNIKTPESLKLGYWTTLLSKSLQFNFKSSLSNLIKERNDSSLNYKYIEFSHLKEQLSQQSLDKKDSSLFEKIKNIEDSILHSLPNLSENIIDFVPDFSTIKSSLKDEDIAIEFCLYLDMLGESNYQYKYAAYIIDNKLEFPEFIVLGDKMEICEYLNDYTSDPLTISKIYTENLLYSLIWEKLIPYLKSKKRVFFSLVDHLSYVNHSLLNDNNKIRIGDKYNLIRVSSTSEIPFIISENEFNYKSAAIYGNINYNLECEENLLENLININPSLDDSNELQEDTRSGWNPLPFSANEILSIKNLLENTDVKIVLMDGNQATEQSFKNLNYSAPDIIHLATHGFSYLDDNDFNKREIIKNMSTYSKNDIYLSWSGLLFSGVNKTWGKDAEGLYLDDIENGILLAEEISRLNLEGVKLVVLSACDTAKGFIDDFGGILGLQKAFKQAGVGTIIMSLWKVADEPTCLLMTHFYEELLNGKERHEALKIAQNKVREIYPDPYYWAAFVILD